MADGPLQFTDHLDPDESSGRELGGSRCPSYPIIEDQFAVRPAIDPGWGHPHGRGAEAGDLSLKLEWIGARNPGWSQTQFPGIDIINIAISGWRASYSGFPLRGIR